MKCEICGKIFNKDDEREEFEIEMPLNYDYFKKNLCAKCAIEVIENKVSGIYFEICENCGKEYDFIEDNSKFESRYTDEYGNYATISDLTNDKLLCLDCAIDEYEKEDNE